MDELRAELAWRWPADVPERRPCWPVPTSVAAILTALPCDMVLNGVCGGAGSPGHRRRAGCRAGNVVGLANKESLIAGGSVVTDLAGEGQLVPVDSEHSALAQCLRAGTPPARSPS